MCSLWSTDHALVGGLISIKMWKKQINLDGKKKQDTKWVDAKSDIYLKRVDLN